MLSMGNWKQLLLKIDTKKLNLQLQSCYRWNHQMTVSCYWDDPTQHDDTHDVTRLISPSPVTRDTWAPGGTCHQWREHTITNGLCSLNCAQSDIIVGQSSQPTHIKTNITLTVYMQSIMYCSCSNVQPSEMRCCPHCVVCWLETAPGRDSWQDTEIMSNIW